MITVISVISSAITIEAFARADFLDYHEKAPNGFEPSGYNINGTAPHLVVTIGGWDATKCKGNVGIGDGSIRTFDSLSNTNVNCTDQYLCAGDISTEPWDFGRIINKDDYSTETKTKIDELVNDNRSISPTENEAYASGDDKFYSGGYSPVFRTFRPISYGRPVNDMLYEAPHAIAISSYCRLTGLMMPDGSAANVGLRCIGYGY